jgi:hypothetical protein
MLSPVQTVHPIGRMLPYKPLDSFVRGVSEFLAELRRPITGSNGRTAQNVAPDAR